METYEGWILFCDGIDGDTKVDGMKGGFQVQGFSLGPTGIPTSSIGAGVAHSRDVKKLSDAVFGMADSPVVVRLASFALEGKHVGNFKAVLVAKGIDGTAKAACCLEMTNVIFMSYRVETTGDIKVTTHRFSINFEKLVISQIPNTMVSPAWKVVKGGT